MEIIFFIRCKERKRQEASFFFWFGVIQLCAKAECSVKKQALREQEEKNKSKGMREHGVAI